MVEIPSPRFDHFYPDRFWECQSALGSAFAELASAAELAGWDALEVTVAIVAACKPAVLIREADKEVDDLLRKTRNCGVKI